MEGFAQFMPEAASATSDTSALLAATDRQLPMSGHVLSHGASGSERTLAVSDALRYLDNVKAQLADQPERYKRFLDVMARFKDQR